MRWMLDTGTCIALIKKHPIALRRLRDKPVGQVGISALTLGELAFGAHRSARTEEAHEALCEFLLALDVADFGEASAMTYGKVRAALARRAKNPVRPLDILIGSHALEIDVTLVTHNPREFSRIPGVRLEDWTEG
jgi:tRNA(fMet)-specific endonuclease VapC